MHGVQQVHGSGAGGQQLLLLGDLGVVVRDLLRHRDEQRHARHPFAHGLFLFRRHAGVATALDGVQRQIGQLANGLAAYHHETPRAQGAMIRRRHGGLQNLFKLFGLGSRGAEELEGTAGNQRMQRRGGLGNGHGFLGK
ncbi:hypothetical protein D9M69_644910 [compost metagenome]